MVKIITENNVFHFLRNWMFLSAFDVCQIPFLTFTSLGLTISFLCPLSLSCVCVFGFNVAFNNFAVISRRCLVATGRNVTNWAIGAGGYVSEESNLK